MATPPLTGLQVVRTDEAVERRLARLEDLEAIRNLKQQYAFYVDAGFDADGFATLFTEDGVWESNRFGTYTGREAIRAFMRDIVEDLKWAIHFATGPVIEVSEDGETAEATWYLFELATMVVPDSDNLEPVLIAGRYHDSLVKIDGLWKFAHVNVVLETISRWNTGWVEERFLV